ncbi:anti-sigma factor C-terminal domain-containing protein [Paenibacillus sp. N3/727]|uniref:anti sigma factor C-terminal domain-containing protein n=1 Tax=Paenibacillus sp. N3/727 TaxID=2925845 RepID=UPI001F52DB3A|nr:anti sigma factor C-terminal domain-containing protein [Paenibacillus sp. N3/727]UNK19174.1 anti-sigma factor C-terminal domain-containing protein [Paenibacillus sp. N3/727]
MFMSDEMVGISGTEHFSPDLLERKKQRSKWGNRIRWGVDIIALVILLTILFSIYMWGTHWYFEKSGKNAQFTRAVAILAEMQGSGMKLDKDFGLVYISPLFKQTVTTKVYRQVGEWSVITGELHAEKSLFGEIRYSIKEEEKYFRGDRRPFIGFPISLIYGGSDALPIGGEPDMERLGHIEDGFVAEMWFSFGKGMTPKEFMEVLSEYDLWVTGMAVYSGEMKDVKVSNYVSTNDTVYPPHLTLRPLVTFHENGTAGGESFSLTKQDIALAEEQLMKDLEWLTSHVNYYGVNEDKQRLSYLKQNGIQVYGATVTGPARELEKLRQVPEFRRFGLGRVEVWNWDN